VNTAQLTPVPVMTGAVAIAAGGSHSLAIKADGTLWAWGWNAYGQLGDGSTVQRSTPVRVTSLTDVVAVAAGHEHSLALTGDGRVWAWGRNASGQLGDGTTTNRTLPVAIAGLAGTTALSAGNDFSLALVTDGSAEGSVWSWGSNASGQLGDGTTLPASCPFASSRFPQPLRLSQASGGPPHATPTGGYGPGARTRTANWEMEPPAVGMCPRP
jgi:alpha-tubulin suppressor-like RCC1 family protein